MPAIVTLKTPSGSEPGTTDWITGGVLGTSVTVALLFPPGPVAVTVSVPPAGIVDGAV